MTGLFPDLVVVDRQQAHLKCTPVESQERGRVRRPRSALGGPADGRQALDHVMIDSTAVVQRGDAISLRPFRRHE